MIKDKIFLDNLPLRPGVYLMIGENREILYVGKARELKKRVSSYFRTTVQDIKTAQLIKHAKSIEVTITHTEHEALLLECFLIKKHKPRYNVLLRDDKTYPYILITQEQPYPRIMFYRGAKKGKGLYFGPYSSSIAVRETIHLIQKLFHLRSCNDSFFAHRKRPCLQYQIGLCSGSCTGLISPEEYQQNVQHAILFLKGKSQLIINQLRDKMQAASQALNFELAAKLRDQVAYLEEIQERQYVSTVRGDADIIGVVIQSGLAAIHLLEIRDGRLQGSRSYFPSLPSNALPGEVVSAFISQHYLAEQRQEDLPLELVIGERIEDREWLEKALHGKIIRPLRGERRKWLDMAESNAQQALVGRLAQKSNIQERWVALQQALKLKQLPQRIECFDISHSMGEETVASCVVFNREGPLKSDYRRFNITGITAGDDVAAMRQAVARRFGKKVVPSEGGKPLPELILIDGGKTQLAAAEQALAELHIRGICLIGVAKGEGRKPGLETLYSSYQGPLHLAPASLALHFIQQIRDEAHRFAITGHRQRRDKKRRTSVLESIPGIGARRRRALLQHFGGLQALESATMEQIQAVPGISKAIAEKIVALFK
jgi:excinuclease ABC subunit C